MLIVRDDEREIETWRDGVRTRMWVSAATGARQLVMFEQWCDPGHGAPLHLHAVEEVLRVLDGEAEIEVDGERERAEPGTTVIVPAGAVHGFVNVGEGPLHVLATLAEPIFEARYVEAGRESRRWTARPET